MRHRSIVTMGVAASLVVVPAFLSAQHPGPGARPDAAARAREHPPRPQDPERRAEMEVRLRERFAGAVRQRLGLDDMQVRRLQEHNRQFAERRGSLVQRERESRAVLREELRRDRNADNPKVAVALQELLKVNAERSVLLEDENKSLGEFLTPVQRARYFALQEAMRRRIEDLRRKAAALGLEPAAPEPPPSTPPPGGPPEDPSPVR